jgi:O-antigen ligase
MMMAGDRTIGLEGAGITTPIAYQPIPQSGSGQPLIVEPSAFLWNVPMVVLCILVLNHFGRPFEFFLVGYKIPFVICIIAGVVVLTTRGLKSLTYGPGLPLGALVAWMLAATAFSTWRGGSANFMLYFVALQIVLFMLSCSSPRSFADVRKVSYFVVGGYFLYSVIGSVDREKARFDMKGTFGNSDDVALFAGFVLPFLVLAGLQIRNVVFRTIVIAVGCGILLRMVGMTGTRAAVPAMLGMLGVYFLRGNGVQRLFLVVMAVAGSVLMIAILPSTILTRFATITKSLSTETVMEESSSDEAMASVAERTDLVKDGIRMTVAHPLFGVGPGEYPDYRALYLDADSGRHKRFFPPHNTYIQVSSEEGVPGLIFYLGFLGATFWTIRRGMRLNRPGSHLGWEQGYRIGTALEASLVYFAICAAFMTCETHPHQYVLAGMAVAFYRISSFRAARARPVEPGVSSPAISSSFSAVRTVPLATQTREVAVPNAAPSRPNSALRRPR